MVMRRSRLIGTKLSRIVSALHWRSHLHSGVGLREVCIVSILYQAHVQSTPILPAASGDPRRPEAKHNSEIEVARIAEERLVNIEALRFAEKKRRAKAIRKAKIEATRVAEAQRLAVTKALALEEKERKVAEERKTEIEAARIAKEKAREQASLDDGLAHFDTKLSPWTNSTAWLSSNAEYVLAIIRRFVGPDSRLPRHLVNIMIYKVCHNVYTDMQRLTCRY